MPAGSAASRCCKSVRSIRWGSDSRRPKELHSARSCTPDKDLSEHVDRLRRVCRSLDELKPLSAVSRRRKTSATSSTMLRLWLPFSLLATRTTNDAKTTSDSHPPYDIRRRSGGHCDTMLFYRVYYNPIVDFQIIHRPLLASPPMKNRTNTTASGFLLVEKHLPRHRYYLHHLIANM